MGWAGDRRVPREHRVNLLGFVRVMQRLPRAETPPQILGTDLGSS